MKRLVGMIALVALATAGCTSGAPSGLTGKWKVNRGSSVREGGAMTLEFTDSKFTLQNEVSQGTALLTITGSGAYTFADGKVTMTTDEVTIDDSKLSPEVKTAIGPNLDAKKLKDQMNQETTYTVLFEGETAILTGAKGTKITLSRVKS